MKKNLIITTVALCAATLANANNLVANGDFQQAGENGGAAHWPAPNADISYPIENGNRFLRLTQNEPGKNVMIYQPVNVAGAAGVKMTFKARWKDVAHGDQNWFDARIMMTFKDGNHGDVPGAAQPGAPNFHGSSDGWQAREFPLKFRKARCFWR